MDSLRVPASMLRQGVLLEREGRRDDIDRLVELERAGWRTRLHGIRDSGVPTASAQGFRSIPSWMPQDPADVNQTTVAAAADTILWNAPVWTPLPANSVSSGDAYKITCWGVTTTAVTASQTLIITPRFGTAVGGTSLGVSRTASIVAAVKTNVPFLLEMWVHFRTRGAAGTATCFGRFESETITNATSGTVVGNTLTFGTSATTATTVDTTAAAGLVASVNASLATQTFTAMCVIPELLN